MCWHLPAVSSPKYALTWVFAGAELMLFYPHFLVSPFFSLKLGSICYSSLSSPGLINLKRSSLSENSLYILPQLWKFVTPLCLNCANNLITIIYWWLKQKCIKVFCQLLLVVAETSGFSPCFCGLLREDWFCNLAFLPQILHIPAQLSPGFCCPCDSLSERKNSTFTHICFLLHVFLAHLLLIHFLKELPTPLSFSPHSL